MNQTSPVLIWAVDALADNGAAQRRLQDTLKWWSKGIEPAIYPVYVVSADRLRAGSVFTALSEPELKEAALIRLRKNLAKVKLPGLKPPEVVLSKGYSLKAEVETLLQRSHLHGANAIFATTFARKGIARLLLGSFSETLVLHSNLPLVTVSPAAQGGMGPVVFGTDFSPESEKALGLLVPLLQRTKSKLLLVHFAETEIAYLVDPLSAVTLYSQKMGENWKVSEAKLERLHKTLTAKGIRVETKLLKKGETAATALVALAAKAKARLLCVASVKGPVGAVLAGSTARQVVRLAKCPVWVLPRETSA